MIHVFRSALLLSAVATLATAVYVGPFAGGIWQPHDRHVPEDRSVTFTVALKLRNHQEMHDTLMQVSDPKSPHYGQFLTMEEIQHRFGPSETTTTSVVNWLQSIMPSANVEANLNGDMIMVSSSVREIEAGLKTRLQYHQHTVNELAKPALRAVEMIDIPAHLHDAIAFVSLNSPVNRHVPMSGKTLQKPAAMKGMQAAAGTVSISTGNKAVVAAFQVTCAGGEGNRDTIPCSSLNDVPVITISFQDNENVFPPTAISIPGASIGCYDADGNGCAGTTLPNSCTCLARVNNVEQYRPQKATVSGTFTNGTVTTFGTSSSFALTDTATAQFLSELYDLPYGLKIHHGSTVAVAEFYDEFYSNADLSAFLQLSGLEDQQIDDANVYGYNNQSEPGGEAQLDVEYLLALAQDAELTFYSIPTYNPYSEENEDFLDWLYIVGNETNPPLVQSLSYGDIEAAIFNASNPGSETYGYRCDQEFMKMGLRGISVIVSSGDDGLASFAIRTDPEWACSVAHPSWPASSPYVTTVGATQLTDQALPFCQEFYAGGAVELPVQCTNVAETTCSSQLGGVIVPGGGFSDVYNRADYATWQLDAVQAYLALDGVTPTSEGYFNTQGRGFPDLAAYGSNYFVYLGGNIVRESGTSASAPVVAAMVALWNDMRLSYGQPPMGFMNPFLYQIGADHPEAFYDVTTGDNACGAGHNEEDINCCDEYFSASAGWDAVNGLGTPKFGVIANLVLNSKSAFPAQGAILTEEDSVICDCADGEDGEDADEALAIAALAVAIAAAALGLGALVYVATNKRQESDVDHEKRLLGP